MTRIKTLALMGTAATLVLAGAAYANPQADANKDGQISKAEFVAAADARFAKADTNGDGAISQDERKAADVMRKQEYTGHIFDRLDADKNGVISRAEFDAAGEKRGERRTAMHKARDGKKDRKANKEKRKDRKDRMKERRSKMKSHSRIQRDANQDGIITLAEHNAATETMFLRLDANGDGMLTKGEGKHRKGGKHRKPGGPK